MTRNAEALLWEYVAGSLEGTELRDVERMLRHSPKKRLEVRRIARQYDVLQQADGAVLSEPVPERLLNIIRRARGR